MNSSTRLYERLGQIPQDPDDPECLDDLVVCAFGAFERYYVCWRNKAGEYRQDGYDLQPALQQWLYPTDGTHRDFESLQVVFGRGDEYFASDKFGKLEYKEPEVKAPPLEDLEEKPALRRARTSVSFLRPLPTVGTYQQVSPVIESPSSSRRSSAASQQSSSRPPSMSLSSRTMSDTSLSSLSLSRPSSDSSFASQSAYSTTTTIPSRPSSDADMKPIDLVTEAADRGPQTASPVSVSTRSRSTSKLRPLSLSFKSGPFPRISEGTKLQLAETTAPTSTPPVPSLPLSTPLVSTPLVPKLPTQPASQQHAFPQPPIQPPDHCTCGYHAPPKPAYADASVQTSPLPSPPRTALRLDTSTAITSMSFPQTYSSNSSAQGIPTPQDVYYEEPAGNGPFFMGRMMDYFSKPGYQLGDSLVNSYSVYQQPVYGYKEEFAELPSWEEAHRRGYS